MSADYDLLKSDSLGSGGYGSVIMAVHKKTGEKVAAKVISTGRMKVAAIEREVKVMRKLQHPNIIRLLDAASSEKDQRYFIYMELAPQGELFSRVVSGGNLTEPQAARYLKHIMGAVGYMHSQGVVHRDLKLENVLLDNGDNCKVCDFGLAHMYEMGNDGRPTLTKLTEVCGSKSYCAPEVLAHSGGYNGFPMDVWSCGICLFAMVAGFFPLDEATGADWRYERVKMAASQRFSATHTIFGFYERECPVSQACSDLIDGMLTISAENRLTVEQVFRAPWTHAEGEQVSSKGAMDVETPVYRGLSAASQMSREQIEALLANEQEAPPSPVYRGGPALGPPPGLSRQNCKFCADFHLEE